MLALGVFYNPSVGYRGEIRRTPPAMDDAGRPQDGKKENIDQAAPVPQTRDAGEESRDQSEGNEGHEPKNLVAGIEFFELGEFERIAQTISVQIKKSLSEVDRREAQAVDHQQN